MASLLTSGLKNCGVDHSGGLVGVDKLGQLVDITKVESDEQYVLLHSIRSNYLILPSQFVAINSIPPIYLQATQKYQCKNNDFLREREDTTQDS